MKLPKYRTENYVIWKCCERFDIKPPGVLDSWVDNDIWTQAQLIAYNQIRDIEDSDNRMEELKIIAGSR